MPNTPPPTDFERFRKSATPKDDYKIVYGGWALLALVPFLQQVADYANAFFLYAFCGFGDTIIFDHAIGINLVGFGIAALIFFLSRSHPLSLISLGVGCFALTSVVPYALEQWLSSVEVTHVVFYLIRPIMVFVVGYGLVAWKMGSLKE